MIAALEWLSQRVRCTIRGHRMTAARIYYAPAKSVVGGYRCVRCGRTQPLLYRWQDTVDGGEGDD